MRNEAARRGALFALLIACAGAFAGCGFSHRALPERSDAALRVATYNVHFIWLDQGASQWSVADWERRRAPLQAAFRSLDADVVALQEVESYSHGNSDVNLALDWLRNRNPDYAIAAIGDPEVFPNSQPIFYRPARLTLRDQGWFFFSDTPDEIYSRTFNGSWPAYASWAEFEDKGGTVFRVYNLHYDFANAINRQLSAQLMASRIAEPASRMPLFVVGDHNTFKGSLPVAILEEAGVRYWPAEGSTFHFDHGLELYPAIDHIGTTRGMAPIGGVSIVRGRFDGEWATDHYPVVGDFGLP